MKGYGFAALLVTVFALGYPSELMGQDYRMSVGWDAGVLLTTSLNDGASASGEMVDLKPDPTWSAGGHFDKWFGSGILGGRASVGVARSVIPWTQGDRTVYSYRGDLSLMLRLVRPNPGNTLIPFLSGGVGLIRWGLGDGQVTSFSAAGARYSGEERFHLAGNAGFGFDYVTPFHWGEGPLVFRLEGRDFIQLASPFEPVDSGASDFGIIHNIYVSFGLQTGVGLLSNGS